MTISQSPRRHPLFDESPPLAAEETFRLFHHRPFSFFLDSGMDAPKLGRYSFIGSDPFLVLKSRGNQITIQALGTQEKIYSSPFELLERLMETYRITSPLPIPLIGGAIGYFSYDLGQLLEHLPSTAVDDLGLPECLFAFYDLVLAFDHLENKVYIISTGFPEQEEEKRKKRAEIRLAEMKERLLEASRPVNSGALYSPGGLGPIVSSNFSHQEYLRAVEAAREYIAAGDIFQVNLSQRFEADLSVPPYELYRRLRHINPAPFAAYLNFDEVTIICASPERFLKVDGNLVETRPIKGTRPRGSTPSEDAALQEELLCSTKDRAEHIMIVDLERNDLGRVCHFGTVKVRELLTLEKYATVFHLTSTVEGKLCPGKSRIDLLKACFPGGSISGAPKVRAMEIIDELEPTKRSIYTGSIGYLSFGGEMDINIVIRTILVKGNRAYLQVGGGIVYDSDPEAEYQETLDKAKALLEAQNLPLPLKVMA